MDGQALIVHRLVMRVVRDALAEQGRLPAVCRAAASVLDARAGVLKGSQDRPAVRDLAGQVMALQDNTTGPACNGESLAGHYSGSGCTRCTP